MHKWDIYVHWNTGETIPNIEILTYKYVAYRSAKSLSKKRISWWHIIVKIQEAWHKGQILIVITEKQWNTDKDKSIIITADNEAQTKGQKRLEWIILSTKKKTNKLSTQTVYPPKQSFKNCGEIRSFLDKQHLKKFMTIILAHQNILKDIQERNNKANNCKSSNKVNIPGRVGS